MFFPKAKAKVHPTLPLEACLAKTWQTEDGIKRGRNVEEHCRIAMQVALDYLKRLIEACPEAYNIFPENSHLPAGLHDVGKISPTFQKKIHDSLGMVPPELKGVDSSQESSWNGHSSVSHAAVVAAGLGETIAWCVGMHHGRRPSPLQEGCGNFGGPDWATSRADLVNKICGDKRFTDPESKAIRKALTGLTILSDWIASGYIFDDPGKEWQPLVPKALDLAGFIWPSVLPDLSFEEIFGFSPNEIQKKFAASVKGPGIYILEAPMGTGKTEAALYAAYKLLAAAKASGIYFGLPTQLTSNRMHERVNEFLLRIFPKPVKAILAHSEAWLKRFLDAANGQEETPASQWFEHGKRAILAPYAVGTADQALIAATRAKWAPLRLFGLTGKVVILDEAHSYDAYTGELMDMLVEHLLDLGCTIIILSATLTSARQKSLIERAGITVPQPESLPAYPLISTATASGIEIMDIPAPASSTVQIKLTDNEAACIEECLERADQGQQIIWIENTVDKAQEIFKLLSARSSEISIETGLIHSRFTSGDRAANEKYWTDILGKPGTPGAEKRSERGRILVGTQVLEQSLDIDADFLISRSAPTDLLLQRVGRLWRHIRTDRPASAKREMWILAPRLETALANPQKAFEESGTAFVYDPYTLARSLEAFSSLSEISLPDGIRPLLEATHKRRQEEPGSAMARAKQNLEQAVQTKIGIAREKANEKGGIDSSEDDFISTRLIETETTKILLLKSLDPETGNAVLLDGTRLSLLPRPQGEERTRVAAKLAAQTVKAPAHKSPEPVSGAFAAILAPFFYEAGKNQLGAIAIGQEGGGRTLHGVPLPNITYDKRIGYKYLKD